MFGNSTKYLTKEAFILNGVLVSYFLLIVFNSSFRPTSELLLFFSDAQEYFSCGKEFYDVSQQGTSITRPFLYPTLLTFFYQLGGPVSVVIFQFICWTISANCIYFGLKKFFQTNWIPKVAVLIFSLNISLISYTFHGLTELVTTLLVSILTYVLISNKNLKFDGKLYLKIVFILSLLVVVKPLFFYPYICTVLIGGVIVAKKFIQPKFLLIFLLTLSPVIFQLTMMKIKYNVFKISLIDSKTFVNYWIAQGIREIENIEDVETSQLIAKSFSSDEKVNYLWNHKSTFVRLYFTNITENVDAYESNFLLPNYTSNRYYRFMDKYNLMFFWISIPFLIGYLILFFRLLYRKELLKNWSLFFIGTLFYYIVFASGISFWQADRLIVFSIPLWITTYFMLLSHSNISNFILERKK